MADTVFNIFGNHLQETAVQKKIPLLSDNANVGKIGLASKGITPAKLNSNFSTPKQIDLKKKTFMKNEGTSLQMFCPKGNESVKKPLQKTKPLQVYEDDNISVKKQDPQHLNEIEFSHKPMFYEDEDDDEFMFTDKQLNNIVFGIPTNNCLRAPLEKPEMLVPEVLGQSINDIFQDDYSELDNDSFSDFEEPIPHY